MKRLLLFMIVIAAVLPASAQWRRFGSRQTRPTGYLGMGFSMPSNPVAARLDAGWNLAGGIGVTSGPVGIMLDGLFTDFGVTRSALMQAGARVGSQRYWALTVGPVVHVNERGPVDFYITGGAGIYTQNTKYRTSAEISGPYSGRYDLISSESIHDPGVNGGVGFAYSFGGRNNMKLFAEARYHHMFTPGSGASFVPVTVGVRF
jgi:hypothetical protein